MSREEYKIDRQYLLDLLTALTELRRELEKAAEAQALWRDRLKIAREKDRAELAAAAEERLGEATERLEGMKVEERRLLTEVESARRQLRSSKAGALVETDAARLLAELQALTGKPDELEREVAGLEADEELRKLRDRFADGKDG